MSFPKKSTDILLIQEPGLKYPKGYEWPKIFHVCSEIVLVDAVLKSEGRYKFRISVRHNNPEFSLAQVAQSKLSLGVVVVYRPIMPAIYQQEAGLPQVQGQPEIHIEYQAQPEIYSKTLSQKTI